MFSNRDTTEQDTFLFNEQIDFLESMETNVSDEEKTVLIQEHLKKNSKISKIFSFNANFSYNQFICSFGDVQYRSPITPLDWDKVTGEAEGGTTVHEEVRKPPKRFKSIDEMHQTKRRSIVRPDFVSNETTGFPGFICSPKAYGF